MKPSAESLVARAFGCQRRGVICDIDGTLSPIAPTPDAARLAPGAREALQRLVEHLDLVAVVSGRAAHDARALVDVPGIVVVGNHGLETLDDHGLSIHPDAADVVPRLKEALSEFRARIETDPALAGVLVEDKGVSASIHYRLVENRAEAEDRLTAWAYELAGTLGLKVTFGRLVIELRPPISINKGAAVRRLVDEYGLGGMLFFGDDVTDIDGFVACQQLRVERELSTWAIGVADPEARPDVIESADAAVESVDACVALLTTMADRLDAEEDKKP